MGRDQETIGCNCECTYEYHRWVDTRERVNGVIKGLRPPSINISSTPLFPRSLCLLCPYLEACFMLTLSPGEYLSLACRRQLNWSCHRPCQQDECVRSLLYYWLQVVTLHLVWEPNHWHLARLKLREQASSWLFCWCCKRKKKVDSVASLWNLPSAVKRSSWYGSECTLIAVFS